MKTAAIFVFLVALALGVIAQQAVVSSGNYHENSAGSVSWGLGETVIQTFSTENAIITQGFQQTRLTITSVSEMPGLSFSVTAYPNPTHNFVNLKVERENVEDIKYDIYDLNGRVVLKGIMESNPAQINFSDLRPGVYIIRLTENNKELKSFKVVKK
jgi:hypothetical protein